MMNAGDAAFDCSFIDEAMPVFLSEAQEQSEQIEQLLLQLEGAPGDRELLNALFRCAHTVKGSAGIFGLDRVVAFTHNVETLLDRLREGELALTGELGTLLLKCNDEIRLLVAQAGSDAPPEDDGGEARRAELVAALQRAGARKDAAAPACASAPVAVAASVPRRWRLKTAFGVETFRNGMDPLALMSYVAGLGSLERVALDMARVPPLQRLDPESCHLTLDFTLHTAHPRADIESAFCYVRDDCPLELAEEAEDVAEVAQPDFTEAIEAMPDTPRLGEILVACGAITSGQLQHALQLQSAEARAGQPKPLGEVLQATGSVAPQVVQAALAKQGRQREAGGEDKRFIRVQADRLDAVINLLGELVVASAGASQLARQTSFGSLIEANAQVGALIEEIRNGTLQLRMVPISETFLRLRRVVRDTAADLGKDVQLEIAGGETELDKSVVERIADPLMHLVRNALDHGLEKPEQRIAAGKPAQGRLLLSACHESGTILIRIADDGRGLQRDKVLQRAWERGLVEHGVVPDDADIDRLIFEPGFSTAEKVTNLSGRGVGMDVVKRNIEALRGSVALQSRPGQGSTIELRLPLTLAIIDGFLVGVGASKFIFPLDAVVEVIEDRVSAAASDSRGRSVVELRGRPLPVVCLRTLYGLPGPLNKRGSVVVLRSGERRFGVRVDALLGQHQTVIKPLGRMLRSLRGMSGSSILGNGEVALIFDVHHLGTMVANPPGAPAHPAPSLDRA
jgi:two-component system chemotaxis sensor kinase CheA